MICPNCLKDSHHLKITARGTTCHNCGGFSETSGASVDRSNTRNSFRVREQQQHYEGDMQPPRVYDPETRRAKVNPEFLKLFPDKLSAHFTPTELRKEGYNTLADKVKKDQAKPNKPDPKVKFKGSAKKAIKRLVGTNGK